MALTINKAKKALRAIRGNKDEKFDTVNTVIHKRWSKYTTHKAYFWLIVFTISNHDKRHFCNFNREINHLIMISFQPKNFLKQSSNSFNSQFVISKSSNCVGCLLYYSFFACSLKVTKNKNSSYFYQNILSLCLGATLPFQSHSHFHSQWRKWIAHKDESELLTTTNMNACFSSHQECLVPLT